MDYTLTLNQDQADLLDKEEGDQVSVEVDAIYEDIGIGPFDYWGAIGIHRQFVWNIESVRHNGVEVPTTVEQDRLIIKALESQQRDPEE